MRSGAATWFIVIAVFGVLVWGTDRGAAAPTTSAPQSVREPSAWPDTDDAKSVGAWIVSMLPRTGLMKAGCLLSASLDNHRIMPGEQVRLRFTLSNFSDKVVWFPVGSPQQDFQLVVMGEHGGALRPRVGIGSARVRSERSIRPGESLTFTYPLSEMYDLSAADVYYIVAKRTLLRQAGTAPVEILANVVYLLVSDRAPAVPRTETGGDQSLDTKVRAILVDRGKVKEGFSLTARPEKVVVVSGESAMLVLTLSNTADEILSFVDSSPECDYDLIVLDARGDQMAAMHDMSVAFRTVGITVQPHAPLSFTYRLGWMYDLSTPGEYRITASRVVRRLDGTGWASVVAETVTQTVVAAPSGSE